MQAHVGIAGFRGYSGMELVRLLERHPFVKPFLMEHRSDPDSIPGTHIPCTVEAALEHSLEVVFLATPHEVSLELTPGLLKAGIRVVDLSGAYRLRTAEIFERWYKQPHTSPALLEEAAYGLPEFYRDRIRPARLVANPGCYPTAANLALRPLVEAGAIDLSVPIVCDAKSGVSGAGRKPTLKVHFCEVTENFSAYSLLDHRHVPEVLQNSGIEEAGFHFVAQLLPVHRGILETIHVRATTGDLLAVYQERYRDEPFVRVLPAGKVPDLNSVRMTNRCDIGVAQDRKTNRAVIVAAIDNLTKGAAGQAIQNMNLLLGYPETEALV